MVPDLRVKHGLTQRGGCALRDRVCFSLLSGGRVTGRAFRPAQEVAAAEGACIVLFRIISAENICEADESDAPLP